MCDVGGGSVRTPGIAGPRWGALYFRASLMAIALAVIEVTPVRGVWQQVLRCGVGLAGFGSMASWVRRNRVALDQQDWCSCAAARMTVRVVPSRRPETPTVPLSRWEPAEDLSALTPADR